MNILKKITKKYKWLRILNYKTTKLAILSAALFGLCLSSGASFAKYRDENYGGGNAGAAKFGGEIVSFDYKTYSIAKITQYGAYAFVASFTLDFSSYEVSINYEISLRIGESSSSIWTNPGTVSDTSFVYINENNDENKGPYTLDDDFTPQTDVSKILTESAVTISASTAYASNFNGWTSSTSTSQSWLEYDNTNDIVKLSGTVNANDTTKIAEHKVMYFVNINASGAKGSFILYNLDITQKGG